MQKATALGINHHCFVAPNAKQLGIKELYSRNIRRYMRKYLSVSTKLRTGISCK
jgi:hypothetical protein